MNFEIVDQLYRSRLVLLNILEEYGYDIAPYKKFSPTEIAVAAEALPALGFTAKSTANPEKTVQVVYANYARPRIEKFLNEEVPEGSEATTEIIFMILDLVGDSHHMLANKYWQQRKLRVRFFSVQTFTFDPRTHTMVPKHELVPSDTHSALLEQLNITSKSQLPLIRYHADPIVRILGAVPGDIIKITRPSPSAGTYVLYRTVAP